MADGHITGLPTQLRVDPAIDGAVRRTGILHLEHHRLVGLHHNGRLVGLHHRLVGLHHRLVGLHHNGRLVGILGACAADGGDRQTHRYQPNKSAVHNLPPKSKSVCLVPGHVPRICSPREQSGAAVTSRARRGRSRYGDCYAILSLISSSTHINKIGTPRTSHLCIERRPSSDAASTVRNASPWHN